MALNIFQLVTRDKKVVDDNNPWPIKQLSPPLTWTLTVVALTGANQTLAAANANRKALRIHNRLGNDKLYYRLDGGVTTSANGLPIVADGQDILDGGHAGVAAITGIGTNTQSVNVWEGV